MAAPAPPPSAPHQGHPAHPQVSPIVADAAAGVVANGALGAGVAAPGAADAGDDADDSDADDDGAVTRQAVIGVFDGGSKGNGKAGHGLGGAGWALLTGHTMLAAGTIFCGSEGVTNNEAEYRGIIGLLEHARDAGLGSGSALCVRGDSKLVLCQVRGEYRCNAPNLVPLCEAAQRLVAEIRAAGCTVELQWTPREQNRVADALSNIAMDSGVSSADTARLEADVTARLMARPAPRSRGGAASGSRARGGAYRAAPTGVVAAKRVKKG